MTKTQISRCCDQIGEEGQHPDHRKELHRISRISGQLEGVKRMLVKREYCPKIITQIQAVRAALKSLESVLLEEHLACCVKEAFESAHPKAAGEKISELLELFKRS